MLFELGPDCGKLGFQHFNWIQGVYQQIIGKFVNS